MSRFSKFEIFDSNPSIFSRETSIFNSRSSALKPFFPSFCVEDELDFALDLLNPSLKLKPSTSAFLDFTSPFDEFDLIQIERNPLDTSTRRLQHRITPSLPSFSSIESLSDRVSALELVYDQLFNPKSSRVGDRKYTWSAEIESPEEDGIDRKYKLIAEIKGGKKKGKGGVEKNIKWTAEIKGKGEKSPISRKYTFQTSSDDAGECVESEKKDKKKKKKKNGKAAGSTRVVEIEEPSDHGAVVLRQAFAKRAATVAKVRGKKKELSPQDAAMMIQIQFRAYLIRRSQALRALRELAIAKAKLKELRALFNNFSYRRRVSRDPEERQRFSEKIIVLLLTVDAIEGADLMVRAAKKSMVDELEAMLDVVDPQPGKSSSLSLRRRTFDMPDAVIQKELAAGVAQVVRMLDQEHNGSETTLEACL